MQIDFHELLFIALNQLYCKVILYVKSCDNNLFRIEEFLVFSKDNWTEKYLMVQNMNLSYVLY